MIENAVTKDGTKVIIDRGLLQIRHADEPVVIPFAQLDALEAWVKENVG